MDRGRPFFVLSGFLIGGILLDARGSPQYFKTFYIRRFFRIIPIYYLWIVAGFFLMVAFERTLLTMGTRSGAAAPRYVYFLFLQNRAVFPISGVAAAWLGPTWSLAVEEQFYLVIPLLIRVLRRRALLVTLTLVIVLAPALRFFVHNFWQPALANLLMPCRADSFAMGIVAAVLWRDARVTTLLKMHTSIISILLAFSFSGFVLICVKWWSIPWSLGMQTIGLTFISLFFVVTLFFMLLRPTSKIASIARMGWIQSIGRVSYCMYLTHLAIWAVWHRLVLLTGLRHSVNWFVILVSLLGGACTFGVARVSWSHFEKPFVLQGHSYPY
jgi:peptidoglycan/LPS O-acetylase OafA/YrhL